MRCAMCAFKGCLVDLNGWRELSKHFKSWSTCSDIEPDFCGTSCQEFFTSSPCFPVSVKTDKQTHQMLYSNMT